MSSSPPGRMVGLMMPTMPRQLENANFASLIALPDCAVKMPAAQAAAIRSTLQFSWKPVGLGSKTTFRETTVPIFRSNSIAVVGFCAAIGLGSAVHADSVSDFYDGKTVRFYIGASPGGGYDLYMRTLVQHMSKRIPGKPNAIVINLPGSGGVKASNYVYNVSPKDGTAVITPFWTHPLFQLIRPRGIKFDMSKMRWIGSMAALNSMVVAMGHTARTLEDAKKKEIVVAASGKGSETYIFPTFLNSAIGTKFKLVLGYRGTAKMTNAMESGEVQARGGSWQSWNVIRPHWIGTDKIGVHVVPEKYKPIARLLSAPVAMARIVGTPPGLPEDRLQALRKAFLETMRDPAFLADAKKRKMDIDVLSGEQVEANIAELMKTPKPILKQTAEILGYTKKKK
jgi:tripartite-type tricarboxylate transporter receptor subunit TctC